jgi:hypothetical protein
LALLLAIQNKHGVNQIMGRERMLANQVAGEDISAQAARARGRKGGRSVEVHLAIVMQAASSRMRGETRQKLQKMVCACHLCDIFPAFQALKFKNSLFFCNFKLYTILF